MGTFKKRISIEQRFEKNFLKMLVAQPKEIYPSNMFQKEFYLHRRPTKNHQNYNFLILKLLQKSVNLGLLPNFLCQK